LSSQYKKRQSQYRRLLLLLLRRLKKKLFRTPVIQPEDSVNNLLWLTSLRCHVTVLLLRTARARRRWLKLVPEGRKNSSTLEQRAMDIITVQQPEKVSRLVMVVTQQPTS
jgi:hypothetical protein